MRCFSGKVRLVREDFFVRLSAVKCGCLYMTRFFGNNIKSFMSIEVLIIIQLVNRQVTGN